MCCEVVTEIFGASLCMDSSVEATLICSQTCNVSIDLLDGIVVDDVVPESVATLSKMYSAGKGGASVSGAVNLTIL